jgi:hypothetical protein
MLDLSVFLDMDEDLRRALKMHRDVNVRGHSIEKVEQSLDRRAPDVEAFISPQRRNADLVFKLAKRDVKDLASGGDLVPDSVSFETRLGLDIQELRRVLVSLAQVEVEILKNDDGNNDLVQVAGSIDAESIGAAAKLLAPRVLEFCDYRPKWASNALGLMQLVFFAQLEHVLTRRSLS